MPPISTRQAAGACRHCACPRATVTLVRASLTILSLLLAAAPGLADAQTLESAKAFVVGLYDRYSHGEPDYAGKDAPKTFSPKLVRLIRRDQAHTPAGDVGALDGDPICDCQDPGGLKLIGVDVQAVGQGAAKAAARIRFGGDPGLTVKLDLVWLGGAWQIGRASCRERV